jgi:hypothetical protein
MVLICGPVCIPAGRRFVAQSSKVRHQVARPSRSDDDAQTACWPMSHFIATSSYPMRLCPSDNSWRVPGRCLITVLSLRPPNTFNRMVLA